MPDTEIAGVVRDAYHASVDERVPPADYVPRRQNKDLDGLCFYVRSALPPGRMVPRIRRVMQSLDAGLPPQDRRTFEDQVSIGVRPRAFLVDLAGVFAAPATLPAMVGLYGVMARSVTRRTREIGIRIALAAATARNRGMVVRDAAAARRGHRGGRPRVAGSGAVTSPAR
jgi:hypothetical protein